MEYGSGALFYGLLCLSWMSMSEQSQDLQLCPRTPYWCTIENGSVAVNCNGYPSTAPVTDKSSWIYLGKTDPFCAPSTPFVVNTSQEVQTKLRTSLLNGSDHETFVCKASGYAQVLCPWHLNVIYVLSVSELLNVSLVYRGQQYFGENGTLSCIITWAKGNASIRKTWLNNEKGTVAYSSRIGSPNDTITMEKYHIDFSPIHWRDKQVYQCGATALAFENIPITVTDMLKIDPRPFVAPSSLGVASTYGSLANSQIHLQTRAPVFSSAFTQLRASEGANNWPVDNKRVVVVASDASRSVPRLSFQLFVSGCLLIHAFQRL